MSASTVAQDYEAHHPVSAKLLPIRVSPDRHRVAILANFRLRREDGLATNTLYEVLMEIPAILVVLGLIASTNGLG
jgi:hypothetical protein